MSKIALSGKLAQEIKYICPRIILRLHQTLKSRF